MTEGGLMLKRVPRIYDDEIYQGFGEQPPIIEIQLGNSLKYLINKEKDSEIFKELSYFRNQMDAEFGIVLPAVNLSNNQDLKPKGYVILLNGVVFEKFEFDPEGDVVNGEYSRERVYSGCEQIRNQLTEIVINNFSKIITQSMVNELVNKVRPINPDVVDHVMVRNSYPVTDLKRILLSLLEEEISVRDMNTILETMAEYLIFSKSPIDLMGKIRERLAFSFIPKYADENNIIHTIVLSEAFSSHCLDNVLYPLGELPSLAFDCDDRQKIMKEIVSKAEGVIKRNNKTIFLCTASIRTAFKRSVINNIFPEVACISDSEMDSIKHKYTTKVEAVLEYDGE